MGQYYKSLVIDRHGRAFTNSSWKFDNGAKLMEHSYIGNKYVNDVLDKIYCNPCQVAWVGDYSENGACVYNDKAEDFNKYYEMCWGENEVAEDGVKETTIQFDMEHCHYFLINHTKHIYLDIEKYVNANKWTETYTDDTWDMCINPLPLLTACGNNQGGGDYYENHVGFNDVGSWALDLIEINDGKPFGYEEVEYYFKEN